MKTLFQKEFLRYGTKPYLLLRYARHRTNALVLFHKKLRPMEQKLKFAIFIPNTFYFNFIIYASIPKPLRRKRSNFDLIGIWGSKKCRLTRHFSESESYI